MKIRKIILYFFLLGISVANYSQNTKDKNIKILFVGNSFTYFWNMPQMVNAMAKLEKVPITIQQSTVGGSTFKQHYNKEKGTKTRDYLEKNNWDYVILQEFSTGPVYQLDDFKEYGAKLANLAKSKGAEPILYMTWGYKSNPLYQPIISKAYNELGKDLNINVIPVGEIFTKARNLRPDLNFYFDDKHPSSDGSYLIALIFYKAITGNSVANIPDRLNSKDENGEEIILSFVLPETAVFFKQLVDEWVFEPKKIIKN
jgi:hypothetical protein